MVCMRSGFLHSLIRVLSNGANAEDIRFASGEEQQHFHAGNQEEAIKQRTK